MNLSNESSKNNKKFGRIMLVLMLVSGISKLCGFARDIILSTVYGAGIVTDAYLATLSIPDMVFELIANAAMIGFVPLAVEKLNQSRDELNKFSSSACKLLLVFSLVFSCILSLFSPQIVKLMVPGFEGESLTWAVYFLRIISITLLFRAVTSIFHAYLNVSKCFLPGAFLGILLDASVILAIFISKKLELIQLLPFGVLLGAVLQMTLLLFYSLKKGFRLKIKSAVFSKEILNLLMMGVPAMLASGLMHISFLFNKALASGIVDGGITMLNNAGKISYSIENIIVSSVATVLYPLLSEYYITGQTKLLNNVVGDSIDKLITFLLPAEVGIAILAEPIIDLLFGHGEFTEENVRITAILMILQAIGIVGLAVQTLLTRALFSMKKIKTSIAISLSLLVVYLVCSYSLSLIWGLYGIALATGLSYTIGGLTYYIVLSRVCGGINTKATVITLLKSAAASSVMAIFVLLIINLSPLSTVVNLILSVGIGIVIYFIMAQLLKLKHASLKPIFKRLIRK